MVGSPLWRGYQRSCLRRLEVLICWRGAAEAPLCREAQIHNVEMNPGKGGQMVRAAGTAATLVSKGVLPRQNTRARAHADTHTHCGRPSPAPKEIQEGRQLLTGTRSCRG